MNNIILFGMKNSGKSTLAQNIARHEGKRILSTDVLIETTYEAVTGTRSTFREIHATQGVEYFRNLEHNILKLLHDMQPSGYVIDTGGGTPLAPENQKLLKKLGTLIWLKPDQTINLQRILANGIPAFFPYPEDPERSFSELISKRYPIYESIADRTLSYTVETPDQLYTLYCQDSIN